MLRGVSPHSGTKSRSISRRSLRSKAHHKRWPSGRRGPGSKPRYLQSHGFYAIVRFAGAARRPSETMRRLRERENRSETGSRAGPISDQCQRSPLNNRRNATGNSQANRPPIWTWNRFFSLRAVGNMMRWDYDSWGLNCEILDIGVKDGQTC